MFWVSHLKYVTSATCGDIAHKIKLKIILTLVFHIHEHWCHFTVRQFLDEIRPLHVRPNAGRYVQHWVTYKWNSLCPPTSFLPPPLSVTATHHFQKLIPLHVLLSPEGKKEEGYFDRRKICWSNSIRRSRSVYDKISQDSKMSVIHMIIG